MFGDNPPDRARLFRFAPLFLVSALAGSLVLILTPGYFWDDWVWLHQAPGARIRVGLELGVWWAGYVSNFILGSADPVLMMRIVAWSGWVVAAISFSFVAYRKGILGKLDAAFLCCLIVASHVAPIRFLVSVGMYNVYIACFWLAAALFVSGGPRSVCRLVALPLFFFSFYLNSLILLYAIFFILIFIDSLLNASTRSKPVRHIDFQDVSDWWADLRKNPSRLRSPSLESGAAWPSASEAFQRVKAWAAALQIWKGVQNLWSNGLSFARKNILFAVLPVFFILITKIIGAVFTALSADGNKIYATYNAIQNQNIFKSISRAFRFSFHYVGDYFGIIINSTPPKLIVPFLVLTLIACAIALWGQPRDTRVPPIVRPLLVGILLVATAVYPYLIVNKAPGVFDFYDARNILPAIPGICLLIIGVVVLVRVLVRLVLPRFEGWVQGVAISCLLSICLATQFILGTDLTKDWVRQMAFGDFVQAHKDELNPYSTVLLNDQARNYRSSGRSILNYEYTGQIAEIFDDRRRFGISLAEYGGWNEPVPLVIDPIYRRRYNIADYDPAGSQVLIDIFPTREYPEIIDIIDILKRYWTVGLVPEDLKKYFTFRVHERALEAGRELAKLEGIAKELEQYFKDNGNYPSVYSDVPSDVASPGKLPMTGLDGDRWTYVNRIPVFSADGTCPSETVAQASGSTVAEAVQGADAADNVVSAKKKAMRPRERVCLIERSCLGQSCEYLYITNGADYKLVLHRPTDMIYARQAFVNRVDPARPAYGFWSSGAAGW